MPGHRKRRQFKQTDAFTRGMVIGLKRAGWSIRQIAADTHLGASTVHRLWRRWLEQGNVAIYRNVGATRVTSARVDRRILRLAVAAPQATCTAILQHVQDTLDHSISTRTISRRLVANGLHSCRPLRRLPLTPPNRRQRLEWCRARSTWMTEWHRVVFSDESRFCLSGDSRRVRVWRRRGERSNPEAIVERPTVRQRGIMVWGAIAYDSRSPLLRIQGTMTAQRYVDDVLRPVTLPYLQGVPNALYQQDNARPHTARISQQALQDVQMLPWPPYSPDLSPIEHVWDIIGRRLHALPQPRSEDELWQMVEREWRAIPQDTIRTLIDSLPKRVAACIAVRVRKQRRVSWLPASELKGQFLLSSPLLRNLCIDNPISTHRDCGRECVDSTHIWAKTPWNKDSERMDLVLCPLNGFMTRVFLLCPSVSDCKLVENSPTMADDALKTQSRGRYPVGDDTGPVHTDQPSTERQRRGRLRDEEMGLTLGVYPKARCRRAETKNVQRAHPIKFKIDTGAEVSVMPEEIYLQHFGYLKTEKADKNLFAVSKKIEVNGMFQAFLESKRQKCEESIYIVKGVAQPLLSCRASEILGLVRRINIVEDHTPTKLDPMLKFPKLFTGLGKIDIPYEIKLKEGANLIRCIHQEEYLYL
ncbi:hypothetical protein LAZ67_2004587 [Cordylochernes scorpioides]|uniref:Transposase n=1 Tax=Cordylochernes scorpioides TaxID=51811 RepID=A0ABY6K414_9ARAC|nr:hypothetical protein LAZ67_2004587 [Cordylochernes scorpioides]